MEFADVLLVIVMLLIFTVIIYNLFAYGRDLVVFPPKLRRVHHSERYPGSPEYDEYTDDESSDDESSDNDDYHHHDYKRHGRENKRRYPNPKHVANYVSSHLSQ